MQRRARCGNSQPSDRMKARSNVTSRHSRCHNRRSRRRARSHANTGHRQTSPAGYDCAAFARPAPRVPLSPSPELSLPCCGEPLRLPLRADVRKSSRRRYRYWAGTGIQWALKLEAAPARSSHRTAGDRASRPAAPALPPVSSLAVAPLPAAKAPRTPAT